MSLSLPNMDPFVLSSGLFAVAQTLATIVDIALGSKRGRQQFDSSILRDLPILFALVEEMKAGVLKSPTTISKSTALAFTACQADLDRLIDCLLKRGIKGAWHTNDSSSQLEQQHLDHNLEKLRARNITADERRIKDRAIFRFRLTNKTALQNAVSAFKASVLFLRQIAME
jgi:hypothetical protein